MTTSRIARILQLLLLITALAGARPAQALTFYYVGPAWNVTDCQTHTSLSAPPCIDGSTTGKVTLTGIASGYTGWVYAGDIASWEFNSTGIASLNSTSNYMGAGGFYMSSGRVTNWSWQVWQNSPNVLPAITFVYPGTYEDVEGDVNPPPNPFGWTTAPGRWINPKILGRPTPDPQIADATPEIFPQSQPDCPPDGCSRVLRGDPIDVATGNMFQQVTDYTTVGRNPLAFIRYYNSMATDDTLAVSLGLNWRHNYHRYLRVVSGTEIEAERPDGRVVSFVLVTGTWTPDTDVDMTLTNVSSTYTLTDHDGTIETYTVAGNTGTLNSIALPNGYTQTLAYSTGKLSTVTDSYSRVLTMSYTGVKLTGVSTPDPATLTYGFTTVSGKNLLTSITYNTAVSTSQTYLYEDVSHPFMLTGITDENGNRYATWAYDSIGRATSSEHAGGADRVEVSYDDNSDYRTVTNPLGEEETYQFTTIQGVWKVSQMARAAASPVASATRNFTYDGNGYLATATDWNGIQTRWTNNSKGLPTSITEAYGTGLARTTTISYDSNCPRKPEVITKTNLVVTHNWDNTTCDLLTTTYEDDTGGSTDGDTEIWTYTYSDYGLVATVTEPRTDTTITTTYDYTDGVLTSITNDLSHVTTVNTYTDGGRPTQVTDPNSVVTDYTYDNRMRLLTKTVNASADEVTTLTRIGSGQINLITFPDSSTIDFNYDNAQRLTTITNTGGETINYTLNDMGKSTTVTFKDSGANTRQSFTATYDVLGNMLTLVGSGGGGQTTTYAYDGMSNRTSTTDANSEIWAQAWDELLRPATVTDPLSNTAAPTYNNLDYVTAQTDFLTYSTSYTRDGFGNAIARSSPDTGSWSFVYDENNNLTGITDARSVVSALTYDSLNRLTARAITGYSGEAEAFTYDSTASSNKGVGRLTSFSDESGSTTQKFDNFGNMIETVRTIGGQAYTTTYGYDLANRVTQIIYPSGRYVNYTYNSSGYLTTVTTKPNGGAGNTNLATSIVHKPFGPIASLTFGNSESHTRTYDNNYWLTDIVTVNGGVYIQDLDFGYDDAGNLLTITDNVNGARDETYTVDELNRLDSASGDYGSRTYTYDDNSGRATKAIGGGATYTTTRVANKNRVDNIDDGINQRDFTWTANGNMATDDRAGLAGGAVANTYGGRDRLESQTVNAVAVTFKVNAMGQRVSKAFSGTTTHYHYDLAGRIIGEANGSNGANLREYVFMDGEPLAQIASNGDIFWFHNNQLGQPQKMTNASRTIVWDREQEPFGETYATPTNTTPTNFRFPGQYADVENGLFQNNFRDYDPTLGFYPEADPIGLAGGLNPYGYALANPTQWTDFYGLCPAHAPHCVERVYPVETLALIATGGGAAVRGTIAAIQGAWSLVRGTPARSTGEQYGPPKPPAVETPAQPRVCKVENTTDPDARWTNWSTDQTKEQMQRALQDNGYQSGTSGNASTYTKDGRIYSFYPARDSVPGSSGVQVTEGGKTLTKITPGQ